MIVYGHRILGAGVLCLVAGVAAADTVRVVKYVDQYVWDEQPVRGVMGDAPTGWGGQSWQGPSTGKTNFYLTQADMTEAFGSNVDVGDIAKISFHTKRDTGDETDGLFFLNLYTVPTGSDDSASWYKSRLTMNPVEGTQVNDVWQLWSSDDSESSTTQLRIRDTNRFGGTYGDVGPWTISSRDYSAEVFGSLAIGTNSADNGNNTYVDGLTITLTDGSVGEFDMQVVPLPSAAAMAGLGLLGCGARRRRASL
jgi:hypothetical protein